MPIMNSGKHIRPREKYENNFINRISWGNVICSSCGRMFENLEPNKSKDCVYCASKYVCKYCGEEVDSGRTSCNHCGAPINMKL